MRIVTFRIDEELLEKIDLLCRKMGMNRSELIRMLLKKYIMENGV